jgi:uncharacterized membrane protein
MWGVCCSKTCGSGWLVASRRSAGARRKRYPDQKRQGEGKRVFNGKLERSIEINVPVRTAYNQWTQFEAFQQFMDGVEEVRQLDDTRVHWKASIAGQEEEWNATIIDQVPDQHVAWRSTSGSENSGVIRFQPLGPNQTRVTAVIDYDPEGIVENIGDKLGFVGRRVEGALEQFKTFIEGRGAETGAWRGEIHDGAVETDSSSPTPKTTRL